MKSTTTPLQPTHYKFRVSEQRLVAFKRVAEDEKNGKERRARSFRNLIRKFNLVVECLAWWFLWCFFFVF